VQASSAPTKAGPADGLTQDLGNFVRYLMTICGPDFFQVVDDLQLSLSQIKALNLLCDPLEEASLKELGDRLGLSLPAISRAVDGLVQRGLVTRTEDADDRRFKRVRPTPEGRELVARLVEIRMAGLTEFLEALSQRDRDRLAAALKPIVAREEVAALLPPKGARA
jgi:DNA-binding MarR family transcriptional regulator